MAGDDETTGRRGGWIGYSTGPHGKDQLTPELRAEAERLESARAARQGRLLCEVLVQVYEHAATPCVVFPAGSALGVESDSVEIAAAVARARDALASWR